MSVSSAQVATPFRRRYRSLRNKYPRTICVKGIEERFSLDEDAHFRKIDVRFFEEEELDKLPFGVLELDRTGKILNYNQYEEGRAGLRKPNVIGRNFFTDVAPCTDLIEFRGPFEYLVNRKKLRATFRYYFPFPSTPRDVSITLIYSEKNDTVWVIIVDDDVAARVAEFLRNYSSRNPLPPSQ